MLVLLLLACAPSPSEGWTGVPKPPGSLDGTLCWSWGGSTVCQWGSGVAPVPPVPPVPPLTAETVTEPSETPAPAPETPAPTVK